MENNEVLESENTPNEVETENTPGEAETPQGTQKEAEPLTKEQKSKLDAFDRIYAENKSLKTKLATNKVEGEPVQEWVAPNDPLDIVRVGKVLNKYSDEEVERVILPYARGAYSPDINGIIQAEKDPVVQAAIQKQREMVERNNKIPEPSSPSMIPGQKLPQDIAKMTKMEHQAYVEDMIKRTPMGGGGGT